MYIQQERKKSLFTEPLHEENHSDVSSLGSRNSHELDGNHNKPQGSPLLVHHDVSQLKSKSNSPTSSCESITACVAAVKKEMQEKAEDPSQSSDIMSELACTTAKCILTSTAATLWRNASYR